MNFFGVLKRVLPFFAGLAVGVVPSWLWPSADLTAVGSLRPEFVHGRSYCKNRSGVFRGIEGKQLDGNNLRIKSKPRPNYTDEARQGNVQGTVVLRVEFLASGEIGSVDPVTELPDGLTEQAVAAARRIEFEPAERRGRPVTVVKQVEYTFSTY